MYKTDEAVGLHKNPTASKCIFVVNEIEMTLLLKTCCFLHCLPIQKQYTYYNILNSIKELFIVLICNYPTSVFGPPSRLTIPKSERCFMYFCICLTDNPICLDISSRVTLGLFDMQR